MEHEESIDEWNMVVINEDYIEIRDEVSSTNDPPISPTHHHELPLQIVPLLSTTTTTDSEDGASSPLPASSSVSDDSDDGVTAPSDWRVGVVGGKKLLKLRLEAVREAVVGVVSKVGNWAMCAGAFSSFKHLAGAAAVTAVLVSLVYVGIRRLRRNVVDRWVYLLREKDEKISQLLFQIAQLKEVLLSRRKVRVHQIK